MSSVQTEPEIPAVADLELAPALAQAAQAQQAEQVEQMPARQGSFLVAIKRAAQRFVRWIDNVDVDGQRYWN